MSTLARNNASITSPKELEMVRQDNNRICSKCAKDTSLRILSPCPIHNSLGEEIYQYPIQHLFLYAEVLAERSIRLIHIYDRSQGDQIRIELGIASINTACNRPEYKALSYVWGKDPSKKKTIVCGDYLLEIGENLYHALWQIREDGDTDVPWWVDAICINQANDAEKAEQVKIMKDIYKGATLVVSWLGPEKENDAAGFALLRTIYEQLGDYSSNMAFIAGPPRLDDLQQLGLPAVEDPQWSWMTDILHRPYFYRVWIIQEIVVARACIIRSGTQRIDRSAVLAFGALLEKFENIKTAVLATLPPDDTEEMEEPTTEDVRWAIPDQRALTAHGKAIRYLPVRELWLFYHGFQCEGLPIASLLLRTGLFEATDRRDKIFALVGLSTNLNPNFISYASTGSQIDIQMIQLQIEVARTSMQESQTWGPLLFSYVNATEHSPQLPSWVPDWSTAGRYPSLVSYHIDDMSSFRQVCWEIKSNKIIRLRGKIFDSVSKIVEQQPYMVIGTSLRSISVGARYRLEMKAWFDECICQLGSLAEEYPTGEDKVDAFWRALIFNREQQGVNAPEDMKESYLDWVVMLCNAAELTKKLRGDPSTTGTFRTPSTFWGRVYWSLCLKVAERFFGSWDAFEVLFLSVELCKEIKKAERFHTLFNKYSMGRKFFRSRNDYLGWVPTATKEGDWLCLFEGCRLPFVIRKSLDGYCLIGGAYVHGFMHKFPEELEESELPFVTIELD